MLTGRLGEVKTLRIELARQGKEKPTALYKIIGNKEINHLSLSVIKEAFAQISGVPKENRRISDCH